MNLEQYITFIALTLLVVASPGPTVLHTVSNSLQYGFRVSSLGILGNVAALFMLVVFSAIGLGAILMASESFFIVLKFCGAIYLGYLGIKLCFFTPCHVVTKKFVNLKVNRRKLFGEAFFVTATNPKALAFVTALLPQFIDTNDGLASQLILLICTVASLQFVSLIFYAWASNKARHFFESIRVRNYFNKIAGVTFIGFAVSLAMSDRKI